MRRFALLALTIVAWAPLGNGQSFPSCANTCLVYADFGDCDPLDNECLCNSKAFIGSLEGCLWDRCTGGDLAQAEKAVHNLCAAVGVTLTPATTTMAAAVSTVAAASTAVVDV